VVTDGFVKAFTHFPFFEVAPKVEENERLLMAWLKRIMINCCIDYLRRASMLPEIGRIPDEVWDLTDKRDNADQLSLYKDLITMIKQLPPKYRLVLNMHLIDDYSYGEISQILHIPVNTCRSNCNRAKSLLINIINQSEQVKYAGHRT
jgi:RNA polymerase sigma factor (sigma-70 family)